MKYSGYETELNVGVGQNFWISVQYGVTAEFSLLPIQLWPGLVLSVSVKKLCLI